VHKCYPWTLFVFVVILDIQTAPHRVLPLLGVLDIGKVFLLLSIWQEPENWPVLGSFGSVFSHFRPRTAKLDKFPIVFGSDFLFLS
jgi:hypothetical protein